MQVRRLAFLMMAAACVAGAAAQPVTGQVAAAGFEGGDAGRVVVEGRWFPILVELLAQTADVQQISLRYEQPDHDGDRVDYLEPLVTVTPTAGMRRVWLYGMYNPRGTGAPQSSVDIYDEQGILVTSLDVPDVELTDSDRAVVLDVSKQRPRGLSAFCAPPAVGFFSGQRQSVRDHVLLGLEERNLPDRWIGLEGVQVLVWDDPDPATISTAQMEAVRDWVRSGGQLILGVGGSLSKLEQSPLADLLTIEPGGKTIEVEKLPAFAAAYEAADFGNAIAVAQATLRPGATSLLRDRAPGGGRIELLSVRAYGSGRVVVSAARLRDLAERAVPLKFWSTLISIEQLGAQYLQNEGNTFTLISAIEGAIPLLSSIARPTEFRGQAGALTLMALLFVGVYVVMATAVSWTWLRVQKRASWNWPVFAVVAALASALSLGAVELMRGFRDTSRSYQFVDLSAGASEARVRGYFGYRARGRTPVDVSFACEGGFVRPMAQDRLQEVEYATPLRYSAAAALGKVEQAPTRATLKQFEGYWQGSAGGLVNARLTAERGTGQITPDSWVESRFEFDVETAWLLYIDPRISGADGEVARPADLAGWFKRVRVRGQVGAPAAQGVLAVDLGRLPRGQKVTNLGGAAYASHERDMQAWVGKNPPPAADEPLLPTLWSVQNGTWAVRLSPTTLGALGLAPESAAGLIACTRGLYQANPALTVAPRFDDSGLPLSARNLMELDVTHWLAPGEAVLLMYAEATGPAPLLVDGEAVESSGGCVMLRVRCPLAYTGGPPQPGPRSDG